MERDEITKTQRRPDSAGESPMEGVESYRKTSASSSVTIDSVSSGGSTTTGGSSNKKVKRGKKSIRVDLNTKLERSRQSARECRARKKLRYQYLEDLVNKREKAVFSLRKELDTYKDWCLKVDEGADPKEALVALRLDKKTDFLKP